MDFFVIKEELKENNYLYGLDDPFYENIHEPVKKFSL